MEPSLQNKIDSALSSLDDLQKASAPNFFYTRLQARIENTQNETAFSFLGIAKPAFLIVTLSLFLLMNSFMITKLVKQKTDTSSSGKPSLQSFASEYDLNNSVNY
jgi:hypothetical protein